MLKCSPVYFMWILLNYLRSLRHFCRTSLLKSTSTTASSRGSNDLACLPGFHLASVELEQACSHAPHRPHEHAHNSFRRVFFSQGWLCLVFSSFLCTTASGVRGTHITALLRPSAQARSRHSSASARSSSESPTAIWRSREGGRERQTDSHTGRQYTSDSGT